MKLIIVRNNNNTGNPVPVTCVLENLNNGNVPCNIFNKIISKYITIEVLDHFINFLLFTP
ncbi:hypothetical protein FACS189459_6550 [Bacilli bacterium]|nr:hypothetical protein FACS189459_6550 [Bacilli bacterium]